MSTITQRLLELAGIDSTASILKSLTPPAEQPTPVSVTPSEGGSSDANEQPMFNTGELNTIGELIRNSLNNYSGPEREALENMLSRIEQSVGADQQNGEQGNAPPATEEPGMETPPPSREDATIHQSHVTDHTQESVNHMGEREQNTYSGWKRACRAAHPGCGFRGDKDIGAATLNGKDVGEWDGAVGSVYKKESIKEETLNPEVPFKAEGPHTISDKPKQMDWENKDHDDKAPNGELRYPSAPSIKIPAEVKSAVKEGKARAEEEIKKAHDQATLDNRSGYVRPANIDFYMDLLDAYNKIDGLFGEGTEDAFKRAQVFVTSLPNWMTHEFPVTLMKFIAHGGHFDQRGSASIADRFKVIKAKN